MGDEQMIACPKCHQPMLHLTALPNKVNGKPDLQSLPKSEVYGCAPCGVVTRLPYTADPHWDFGSLDRKAKAEECGNHACRLPVAYIVLTKDDEIQTTCAIHLAECIDLSDGSCRVEHIGADGPANARFNEAMAWFRDELDKKEGGA